MSKQMNKQEYLASATTRRELIERQEQIAVALRKMGKGTHDYKELAQHFLALREQVAELERAMGLW